MAGVKRQICGEWFTSGLNRQRHVVSRVISLPEESELLVRVDLFLFGLVLQSLSVPWKENVSSIDIKSTIETKP